MLLSLLLTAHAQPELPADTLPESTQESEYGYRRYPPPPPPPHRRPAPAPAPAPSKEAHSNVALTVEGAHLFLPMMELTAEFKLDPKFSLAAIGGLGSWQGTERFDLGLQGRGYISGHFNRGVFLGVEGRYTNLGVLSREDNGVAVGTLLGFKYVFDVPLTLDGQLGVDYVHAETYDAITPVARLGVGWSF